MASLMRGVGQYLNARRSVMVDNKKEPNDSTPDERTRVRERELRVARDWLIPSTLIIGICVSIILYIFSLNELTTLLKLSAIASLLSMMLLTYNILHLFMVIGDMEFSQYSKTVPTYYEGLTYILSLSGMLTFLLSICLLCFSRSILVGIVGSVMLLIMAFCFAIEMSK
jgi:membrane-associated HD superfamily phosphohydrolase